MEWASLEIIWIFVYYLSENAPQLQHMKSTSHICTISQKNYSSYNSDF